MRFSVTDLLIATAAFACGFAGAVFTMKGLGYARPPVALSLAAGIPLGAILYLFITPPIYRYFGMLPLILPRCPHCRKLPGGYRVEDAAWPRMTVQCGQCNRPVELWWKQPVRSDISSSMPVLLLSWPHSIGRWCLVANGPEHATEPAEPPEHGAPQ